MTHRHRLLIVPLLLATGLAGCPTFQPSDFPAPAGRQNPGDPAADQQASDSTAVAGGLSGQFPDCGEPAQAAAWQAEILHLVNAERVAAGLEPLERDTTLEAQADQYACELIQYDFFAHVNPVTGSTLADRAAEFDYDFLVIGENLAAGQTTPEEAVQSWMSSPGHRQNILDPRFTELGVGVRNGGQYGVYWVQEFGRPFH